MKKLLFATALVASAAAFADAPTAINAISFEGYTATATFANGAAELDEGGNAKTGFGFFYYQGDQDGSSVKAFGGENAAAPSITRPYFFQGATPAAKYLDLSTEGGTLWRSINAITHEQVGGDDVYDLGTAQTISADGLYLDTLVQFTPTEDGGDPTLEQEDKLAIWLNVNEGATNLMVRAKYCYFDGAGVSREPTNFIVNASIVAGNWYRLTVKAVQTIVNPESGMVIPAFQIFIDGNAVAATTPQIATQLQAMLTQNAGAWITGMADLAAANQLFPSLAEDPASVDDVTLSGVGFKGSGALDDIVWTDQDPFANAPTPEGYVVDLNGTNVTVSLTEAQLAAMAQAGVNTGSVAVVNETLNSEIGGEGATGVKVWEAAILGLPPTEAGLESFKIASISFNDQDNVVVSLSGAVHPQTGQGLDIMIKLMGSSDLSNWSYISTATITTQEGLSTATFAPVEPALGETHKFYKAVVEFAATAQD